MQTLRPFRSFLGFVCVLFGKFKAMLQNVTSKRTKTDVSYTIIYYI